MSNPLAPAEGPVPLSSAMAEIWSASTDAPAAVDQPHILEALRVIRERQLTALVSIGEVALAYDTVPLTGRTHNMPAQMTTVGKRFADCGEALLRAYDSTCGVADEAGWAALLFPEARSRTLDQETVRVLSSATAPLSSLAVTMRLMQGYGLLTDGSEPDITGLSAPVALEQVNALATLVAGDEHTLLTALGRQWDEGDFSYLAVKRIVLPRAFLATDALYQIFSGVLDRLTIYPEAIASELDRNLPFLATTKILVAAVRKGVGREVAHRAIKEHAVAVALELRSGRTDNNLFERLAGDPRLQLSQAEILALVANPLAFTGLATRQVGDVVGRIKKAVDTHRQVLES